MDFCDHFAMNGTNITGLRKSFNLETKQPKKANSKGGKHRRWNENVVKCQLRTKTNLSIFLCITLDVITHAGSFIALFVPHIKLFVLPHEAHCCQAGHLVRG
jgi:hypothetical protein